MSFEPDRPRRAPRPSEEFSGLEEIHEHIDESDDDILVDDEEPASKRKSETESLRHSNSKELLNTSKGKVKRATSKDLSKKNLKSLKRTQSKDGDLSGPSKDETPGATSGVKKKVFQAKGGGLKSKKAEVRKSSESTTASSDKKSTVKRKSRKSRKSTGGGGSASEIEASRYDLSFNSFNASSCSGRSKKSSRSNSSIVEQRLKRRKSDMRRVSGGTIVKRKSLTKKTTTAFLDKPGRSKIQEYVKLFEDNCGGVAVSSFTMNSKSYKTSTSNSSLNGSRSTLCGDLSMISKAPSAIFKNKNDSHSFINNSSVHSTLPVVNEGFGGNKSKNESHSFITNSSDNSTLSVVDEGSDGNNESTFNPQTSAQNVNPDNCSSIMDYTGNSIMNNATDSINEQSASLISKSDLGSKNNLLGSFSNHSELYDESYGISSDVAITTVTSDGNSSDMTTVTSDVSQSIAATRSEMVDEQNDSQNSLSSEPILTDRTPPQRRCAKLRRSSSIRRSKFGKLDQSMRSKWSPHTIVYNEDNENKSTFVNREEENAEQSQNESFVIERENAEQTQNESFVSERNVKGSQEVRRSVSTRAAKDRVIKTIVKAYDLRRRSNNTTSDLNDTLTSLTLNDTTISSKSDTSVGSSNDKRTNSCSKVNTSDSKLNSKKTSTSTLKPLTEKKSSELGNIEGSAVRKTRYSHVRSSYAQNAYTPVVTRRMSRLANNAKTSNNEVVRSARSVKRSTSNASVETKGKQTRIKKGVDIQIEISDEMNNTSKLSLNDDSVDTATDSSDVFTIKYDAKHSPRLKHSRKRRNLQSSSAVRKKISQNVSPSRELVERRKLAKNQHQGTNVSHGIDVEKYLNVSASVSSISESDITSSILTQFDYTTAESQVSESQNSQEDSRVLREPSFYPDNSTRENVQEDITVLREQSFYPGSTRENNQEDSTVFIERYDSSTMEMYREQDTCTSENYQDNDQSSDFTVCTSLPAKELESFQSSITSVASDLSSCDDESNILMLRDTNRIAHTPVKTSHPNYHVENKTSITPCISGLTLCTPLSKSIQDEQSNTYMNTKSFAEMSSITAVQKTAFESVRASKTILDCSERSEDIPKIQIHTVTPHPNNKENRVARMQQGARKRPRNRNASSRDIPRGRRVCPLGKSSLNKSGACSSAIKNFLGKTHSPRRNNVSMLNSILEE